MSGILDPASIYLDGRFGDFMRMVCTVFWWFQW